MARRRQSGKKEVSLFPFLDILGCLIGSLILIITTVVLEQMDSPAVAEAAKIDDMKQQAVREAARLADLEKRLDDAKRRAGSTEARLAAAQARAEEAARRRDEARRQLADAERMQVEKPPLPPPPDSKPLEAERAQLLAEIARIEAEIAARRVKPEQSIAILPPGSGGGPKRGFFVEAAQATVVVHDPAMPWEAPTGKALADPRFTQLLDAVKKDSDAIVTFLVRPDGIATYGALQKAADAAGARTGRVPLPGAGKIDLSGAR